MTLEVLEQMYRKLIRTQECPSHGRSALEICYYCHHIFCRLCKPNGCTCTRDE